MEVYGVIYLITCLVTGMKYVGQTTRSVELRFKEHAKTDSYIGNAIRAHGAENFTVVILKECYSKEELDHWEMHFIKSHNTMVPCGYNMTEGGEGNIPSEETRVKMSAMRKGVPKSPEHRAKIGASNRGKKASDETRAKIGAASTGRRHSDETRAKMSEDRKGEKNAFFGRHHTPEMISKSSEQKRAKSPYINLLSELDARKWSYNHLAELLSIAQPTISNKMRGNLKFSPEDCKKLLEIFGLPIEYLLARDDGKESLTKKRRTQYKNLLAEMDKRQITYGALAKLLELNPATISEKMTGKYNFTAKDIAKLVEIFGKPADYLMARSAD